MRIPKITEKSRKKIIAFYLESGINLAHRAKEEGSEKLLTAGEFMIERGLNEMNIDLEKIKKEILNGY